MASREQRVGSRASLYDISGIRCNYDDMFIVTFSVAINNNDHNCGEMELTCALVFFFPHIREITTAHCSRKRTSKCLISQYTKAVTTVLPTMPKAHWGWCLYFFNQVWIFSCIAFSSICMHGTMRLMEFVLLLILLIGAILEENGGYFLLLCKCVCTLDCGSL